jgi:hypothetical protein
MARILEAVTALFVIFLLQLRQHGPINFRVALFSMPELAGSSATDQMRLPLENKTSVLLVLLCIRPCPESC